MNKDNVKEHLQKLEEYLPVIYKTILVKEIANTKATDQAVVKVDAYNTNFYPTNPHHKLISKIVPHDDLELF